MKTPTLLLLGATLAFGISGCQGEDAENTAEGPPAAASDAAEAGGASSLLAGPIPQCAELTSPSRKAYRIAAIQDCDQARTFNERMNSVGCQANAEVGQCLGLEEADANGYDFAEHEAEKEQARHQ